MSRLTLRLPNTLHNQVRALAEHESISINQYVVYALTRQVTQAYDVQEVPDKVIRQQRAAYIALLQSLGQASFEEIKEVLDEREEVELEIGLNPEVIEKLQSQIAAT
ncbi:MAG: type II toxin-antitoxin system HicB family antitoxin [Phycisphaerae bacterium]|nr:type II toxin-antitoxin system HicB family antitoxin [Phycisphaerae bacterium]